MDNGKAKELYYNAFEIDPTDPYPLGNFIELEIAESKDVSFLSMLVPVIKGAIERSRDQIDVEMNLPWAYFDMGKFYLFLNKPQESLSHYAKAIQVSKSPWEIETSLSSLERMEAVKDRLHGFQWAKALLVLGLSMKLGDNSILKRSEIEPRKIPQVEQIVIVAGGCDTEVEERMEDYKDFLTNSFKDLRPKFL